MPSLDQIFPYVLRWGQRATDGGACVASRSHCWSGSQHECQADLWHRSTSCYSILFHAQWCAYGAWLIVGEFANEHPSELKRIRVQT
jgi:hypothetical protein